MPENYKYYGEDKSPPSDDEDMFAVEDRIAHGTTTGYATHGCRCGRCKAASNEYSKQLRKRNRAALKETKSRISSKQP